MIDMRSARKARAVARPRQVAMYLARYLTVNSLPSIGRHFGNRDHTTVMYAIKHIEELTRSDAELGERVSALRRHFSGETADEPIAGDAGVVGRLLVEDSSSVA